MANPKRRHSNPRTRTRRAHDHLHALSVGVCPRCKQPKRPHAVCSSCGYYRGKPVVEMAEEKAS